MRVRVLPITGVALGLFLALLATPARADEVAPLPPPARSTASGHVPMPDLRGLQEERALRVLAEAGLRVGSVERVSVERLQTELGARYPAGMVVQQVPHPSTDTRPVSVARGSLVQLRVATAAARPVPPVVAPPAPEYEYRDVRAQVAPPSMLGRSRWHARVLGGGSIWSGDDHGEFAPYAGADVGYTFANGLGADVFYRAAGGRFDRVVPGGLIRDGGVWHHIGVKGTYVRSFGRASRLFGWVGVGASYFTTTGYAQGDAGIGGFAEAGIGYVISWRMRARLGVNLHVLDSDVTRRRAADDGSARTLWLLAPTLGLELDI